MTAFRADFFSSSVLTCSNSFDEAIVRCYHPFKIFRMLVYKQMTEGSASRREGGFCVSPTVHTVFAHCQWRTWVNDCSSSRPLTIHSVQLCSRQPGAEKRGMTCARFAQSCCPCIPYKCRSTISPRSPTLPRWFWKWSCWLVPAQMQHRSWLITAKTSPLVVAVCWSVLAWLPEHMLPGSGCA